MQLTNETLAQTVNTLSGLVQMSESSPVEQNMDNLNSIASTLINVATFVNESTVEINETVSYTFHYYTVIILYLHKLLYTL